MIFSPLAVVFAIVEQPNRSVKDGKNKGSTQGLPGFTPPARHPGRACRVNYSG
jgi:hypothetical protein